MSAYRAAHSIPTAGFDPSFYTSMTKDMLAVESRRSVSCAKRLAAYHAIIYRTELSFDEVLHARGRDSGCDGAYVVGGRQDLHVECIAATCERQSVNVCGFVKSQRGLTEALVHLEAL